MTRTRILMMTLMMTLLGLGLAGCQGSGFSVSREGFTVVEPSQLPSCDFLLVDYPVRVALHVGQTTQVVFPADLPKEIRDDIELRVKESSLLITSRGMSDRSGFWTKFANRDIHLDVYLPKLYGVEATHASSIQLMDSLSTQNFSVVADGASRVTGLQLSGDTLSVVASGASQVEASTSLSQQLFVLVSGASHVGLRGSSALTQVSVDGASGCDAGSMSSRSAEFLISGASRGSIGQVDSLAYSVSGASKFSYHGHPTISSQSCTGASSVKAH